MVYGNPYSSGYGLPGGGFGVGGGGMLPVVGGAVPGIGGGMPMGGMDPMMMMGGMGAMGPMGMGMGSPGGYAGTDPRYELRNQPADRFEKRPRD